MRDALRLAFGTLTVLPVRPPSTVGPRVAGWAMASAPAVGALLGAGAACLAWVLAQALHPLLTSVLLVALLAVATRLIHWDGLADTADGLGSGRPAEGALEVMRRSDIGPFGVFAMVAVFAVQVVALADLVAPGVLFAGVVSSGYLAPLQPESSNLAVSLGAVVAAVVLGRFALVLACRSGVPAARPDGLGAAVAGSVGPAQLVFGAAVAVVAVAVVGVLDPLLRWPHLLAASAATVVWAVAGAAYLRRRLGGMTGDTLGALVETTTALALVVLAAG